MVLVVKSLPAVQEIQETRVQSLGQETPWRRAWHPTPVFLPGESHGWRSLEGYCRKGCKESDMTEHTIVMWRLNILRFQWKEKIPKAKDQE